MTERKPDNIKFLGKDLEVIEEHQKMKSKTLGVNLTRQQSVMTAVNADLDKLKKESK